jgi:L-asparaginase
VEIKFFSTGGTIDKVLDDIGGCQIGPPTVAAVLESLPLAVGYEVESLLRKDSLEIEDADRRLIRDRVASEPSRKVIITHGTDRMVETALALLRLTGKTVVLTGSMAPFVTRPAEAVFNIGLAIGAIASLPEGTYIAMSGRIFDPKRCRKNREKGIFEEIDPGPTA